MASCMIRRGYLTIIPATPFLLMKLAHILALALGLFGGCSFAESASDESHLNGTVWAMGVSKEGGWYDANKNDDWSGDADDCLCYAASAANLIAWWQNSDRAVASAAPTDVDDIWNAYVRNNLDWEAGGAAHAAINWWLTGVYSPVTQTGDAWDWAEENDPVWERFYAAPEQVIERDEEGKPNAILPLTLPNYQKDNEAFGGYYYDQYGLDQEDLSDFMVIV